MEDLNFDIIYARSLCQMVIEISGVNIAYAFLHKEIFKPRGSRMI